MSRKHAERAERELADAKRRYEALRLAVETAADELLEVGAAERDKLIESARQARERAVAQVDRAASDIEQAIAEEQAALSVAHWAQDPTRRRWKVALASGEVGRPAVRIDRLIAGNAALGPWLGDQPLPGEEPPERVIKFGWGGGPAASTRAS